MAGPPQAKPQAQHQWLQKLVGQWTFENEASMGPGQPPHKASGIEIVRPVGGLWVVAEGAGQMPGGGQANWIMTIGYDPDKGRFVGTWIGSMMSYLWLYDGELDSAQRVLTLNAEGPAMSGGKMAKYQDIIEVVSDDHRLFRSQVLGEDGQWQQFMTGHYRRVK